MHNKTTIISIVALGLAGAANALTSPSGDISVSVFEEGGKAYYSVSRAGKPVLEKSPLGFVADTGDYSAGLAAVGPAGGAESWRDEYGVATMKKSHVVAEARRQRFTFRNRDGNSFDVLFHVSDAAVAFRYEIPRQRVGGNGDVGAIRITSEATGFTLPYGARQWTCPQSAAMIGWKRTKPSYEEEYVCDAPVGATRGGYGNGWTFPCLFRTGDTWLLVSETGTDSRYCACRLGEVDGMTFKVEFPMPEENNGNGTCDAAFSLPGATPWRTVAIGALKDIVESTISWDIVEPRYETVHKYGYGASSWSWIVWDDPSMNQADQERYLDLAAAMGWKFILVDAFWDKAFTRDEMSAFVERARRKGVGVFLWYSSSGWWNDIVQSPINAMCDAISRKKEMRWLSKIGVKGVKVDFWGGDKQETLRLYEQVLSDAEDNALMVIFHGCTLPRGWERMYPNYAGSEAVLASENQHFSDHFRRESAHNAALHPFIRNAVGCMEFGGTFLNKSLERSNGTADSRPRYTTDRAEIATAVLFQNPVQNFALTPNNMTDAPGECIDFMKKVPTTWDDVRFIDGYPGKFVVLARRSGRKWYVAGIAAEKSVATLDLSFCGGGRRTIEIAANDGFVEIHQAE